MKELIVKSPKESIPFLNTKTFTPEKKKGDSIHIIIFTYFFN